MRGPLAVDLRSIEVPLSDLFLDPNNPRFVGSEWVYIPDHDAIREDIQKTTSERLFSDHEVDKLKSIMEYNGYLPIDRVVVRQISDSQFIVLEGNRRICAAKSINGFSDTGDQLPSAILDSFKLIPCLLYEGANEASDASWIFQGLRHISGISEWPAFNKAKLIVEQMESRDLTFTEVGKGFGLSAFGAAQWVRGYYAFQQAKDETEFGRYIDEKIYPFFQELFGRSSIALKEWLRWSEDDKKFLDAANLNEFVSWFYPVELAEDGDGVDREPSKAEVSEAWSRRRISKRDDLRSITYLIQKSSKNWMEFRSGTDIDKSYNRALLDELEHDRDEDKNAVEKFFSVLHEADKQLQNTPLSVLSDDANKKRLNDILESLRQTEEKIRGFLK
ncbi:ParB N-terminal domain-containing protein [Roseicyclus marinus]|uniref:hypothetical protein n=1 Tax=Roseicyclus marinus TaxID=2161673 RepID=UPI0024102B1F|nr:hypothetical protein [Roseicyclus marinus]MDG3041216.1 hypothetical protein [Roseicyclus marinus]